MSQITRLVVHHFSELRPLDFVLIAAFTLLLAFAIARASRWAYQEALSASRSATDTYKGLVETYRGEVDEMRRRNEELSQAKAALENRLADETAQMSDQARKSLMLAEANFMAIGYIASQYRVLLADCLLGLKLLQMALFLENSDATTRDKTKAFVDAISQVTIAAWEVLPSGEDIEDGKHLREMIFKEDPWSENPEVAIEPPLKELEAVVLPRAVAET